MSLEVKKRPNLSVEQRLCIKILFRDFNKSAEEIREHQSLKLSNDELPQLRTIKYWIDRFEKTGDVLPKPLPGRPRIFDSQKEKELIEYIKENNKLFYSVVRSNTNLNLVCSTRTINTYALRNNIRKF